ncbi:relA-associated inhibitor [Alligator mississippiensis]|uniref:RelA-associated inhibitor n=1 Tax=Alligator mississippiensis TaxID=8496 RepID=A0A151MYI8_ALLMI|nr:relA-associated inhibitor [Alligator mississippiensis]KYO29621.1 relA-associated inhibitor [Alligator mississippiensis]
MASDNVRSARDLSTLGFQSLAMKNIDLKQMELDSAAAKVDELSRQLQSLWTDSPGQAKVERLNTSSQRPQDPLGRAGSPSQPYARKSTSLETTDAFAAGYSRPASPRTSFYLPAEPPERAQSPRPKVLPVPYEPHTLPSPGGSPRLQRPYEYRAYSSSPRPAPADAQMFFPDRTPPPRLALPPPYESHSLYPTVASTFAPFRAQDDLAIRRRPQKSWNESDLDVAYEKKPSRSGSHDRGSDLAAGPKPGVAGLQLAPWRESSLDGGMGQGKEGPFAMHSATLPRNYKVSLLASERRADSSLRRPPPGHAGTLPRSWQVAQQPVSRIAMPPSGPQAGLHRRHKPLPLSMIFRLQNAFWKYGAAGTKGLSPGSPPFLRSPLKQPQLQQPLSPLVQSPPALALTLAPAAGEGMGLPAVPEGPGEPVCMAAAGSEVEPELETLLQAGEPEEVAEVPRPLSPTRLQPVLPPEAQTVPEFEEVARVLAEMPRPLKRRGSMEQSPGPVLPPTHKKQYQQIISRLFHHRPRREEPVPSADTPLEPSTVVLATPSPTLPQPSPPGPASLPLPAAPESPASPEKRSVLRKLSSPRRRLKPRVRMNPLVLLLDAALAGELDVVQQAVSELNDASQPNDEGITALHNAICGANYDIVEFLINIGANVNSPDSHGWTPLHCAASCNDTAICMALVKHGAAIFATTFSDGSMALEKCDPYREGYTECFSYLADVEQGMGLCNGGVVYALWDYSAELDDELSFHEGEAVTVLQHNSPEELDWWWASLYGHEGYVPRNYFGLFPRVRPQWKKA